MGRGWINCTPVWVVAVAAGWALSGCSDGPITSGSGDAIAVDARVVDAQAAADARVADAAPGPEVGVADAGEPGDATAPRDAEPTSPDASSSTTTDGGMRPPRLGDTCTGDLDCLGLSTGLPQCLNTTTFVFPGFGVDDGYCSGTCLDDSDCGADGVCLTQLPFPEVRAGLCIAACDAQRGCADPGLACMDRAFGLAPASRPMCLPYDPQARNGDPCDNYGQCPAGSTCLNDALNWPGGMCAQIGCEIGVPGSCPAGNTCTTFNEFTTTYCLPSCSSTTTPSSCRAGYHCIDDDNGDYCYTMNARRHAANPCQTADDCSPGNTAWECMTGPDWPDGYCTNLDCNPALPGALVFWAGPRACNLEDTCVTTSTTYATPSGENFCARECQMGRPDNCPPEAPCRHWIDARGRAIDLCLP